MVLVSNLAGKKEIGNKTTLFGPRSFMAILPDEEKRIILALNSFFRDAKKFPNRSGDNVTLSVNRRLFDGKAFEYFRLAKKIMENKLARMSILWSVLEIEEGENEDLLRFTQFDNNNDVLRSVTIRPECLITEKIESCH